MPEVWNAIFGEPVDLPDFNRGDMVPIEDLYPGWKMMTNVKKDGCASLLKEILDEIRYQQHPLFVSKRELAGVMRSGWRNE